MQLASNDGCEALKSAWLSMPVDMQEKMKKVKAPLWASAQAIDKMNEPEPEQPSPLENQTSFNPAKIQKKEVVQEQKQEQAAPSQEEIANNF